MNTTKQEVSIWTIFLVFLQLGFTSFGGPVAHLSYFREEFVLRRKWLTDEVFSDLVALCQFLPGPASSQVGLGIGFAKGGYAGALVAWCGFTLPSAIALILFAGSLNLFGSDRLDGVVYGLKIAAAAVVAKAVWGMGVTLCPDVKRKLIALIAAGTMLLLSTTFGQISLILSFALLGLVLFKPEHRLQPDHIPQPVNNKAALFWIGVFFILLFGLPVLAEMSKFQDLALVDAFYRAGALVFGGGHVVLPLLQAEIVSTGWVDKETFLAGYGATQAVPGPLFTFAAFLGASLNMGINSWYGGLLCLAAIFLPSFCLIFGILPFWEQLRSNLQVKAALMGVNAAVVGLLLAAFYDPVLTSSIQSPIDAIFAALALTALSLWRVPVWLVVLGCALIGSLTP